MKKRNDAASATRSGEPRGVRICDARPEVGRRLAGVLAADRAGGVGALPERGGGRRQAADVPEVADRLLGGDARSADDDRDGQGRGEAGDQVDLTGGAADGKDLAELGAGAARDGEEGGLPDLVGAEEREAGPRPPGEVNKQLRVIEPRVSVVRTGHTQKPPCWMKPKCLLSQATAGGRVPHHDYNTFVYLNSKGTVKSSHAPIARGIAPS